MAIANVGKFASIQIYFWLKSLNFSMIFKPSLVIFKPSLMMCLIFHFAPCSWHVDRNINCLDEISYTPLFLEGIRSFSGATLTDFTSTRYALQNTVNLDNIIKKNEVARNSSALCTVIGESMINPSTASSSRDILMVTGKLSPAACSNQRQ